MCLLPLLSLLIYWDGNVSFCPCDDDNAPSMHLGSVAEQSLADIYQSERVAAYTLHQPLMNVREIRRERRCIF